MGSKLRMVLVVVAVLIVLILVLPFLIPVNQFRPIIEEKASAALGRKVQIGDVSLSLFSGSLSAENLSVGDDSKFSSSPFLTAKSLKVGVELMPLIFSKTLKITGVTIDTPQLTLLHSPAGAWNFSSLGGTAARAEAKQAPAEKTSNAAADLSISKLELKNGRISVGETGARKPSSYDNLDISASDVSMVSRFPVTVTADLPQGGKFKLDGTAGPVELEDTSLTPLDATLAISAMNLAATGFLDPAAGLGGVVDLNGTVSSRGGESETKGSVKLSKALLVAGGSPAGVPVDMSFNTRYNLRKNAGVLNPSVLKIGSAAAHVRGTYDTSGEATVVKINMDAKDMPAKDLEAFLPALGIHLPKGASLEAGTLNSDLKITGPTNKLVITGNVGLFNGKLAGFDLGSKMSAVSALAGIKTGSDLLISKLTSDVRMAPEGLKADNFIAVLPQLGNLTGAGTADAKNNLDFKMVATLLSSPAPQSGGSGDAGNLSGLLSMVGGGGCKSGLTVPFQVKGTTADPKFVPDVEGLAAEMFKSKLGCVGGNSSAAGAKSQANPNANPVDAITGLFKKKKP